MIATKDYAPPQAIIVVIIVGAVLIGLGVAIYKFPNVGWAMARYRMTKSDIEEYRREHPKAADTGFRIMAALLVIGGFVIIGVAIKSALT